MSVHAFTVEKFPCSPPLPPLYSAGSTKLLTIIIPQVRVGYEMVDRNKREWNNCIIKNAHKL